MSSSEDKLSLNLPEIHGIGKQLFYMSDIKYDPSSQSQLTVSSIKICRRS